MNTRCAPPAGPTTLARVVSLRALLLSGAGIALGLVLASCGASAPGPRASASAQVSASAPTALGPPCASVGACEAGSLCVAGRCRAPRELPVDVETKRLMVQPEAMVLVSSASWRSGPGSLAGSETRDQKLGLFDEDERLGPRPPGWDADPTPESFPFGRRGARGTLFLRFRAPWADTAKVHAAYLVLHAVPGSPAVTRPVKVEVARIVEAWSPSHVSSARQPRLDVGGVEASLRAHADAPLRVEVTELVARWSQRARDEHGLALTSADDDPEGLTVSLGMAGGRGPALEVYLR